MQQGSTGGENVRRQAESTAATVAEQAQQTAETHLSTQKDQAASTLHSLAESIREGGQKMREEQPQIASLAEQAAGKVDQASSYIRQHDVHEFVREAENFARREPLIFLGGAFAVGFLAARFLKASGQQGDSGRQGSGRYDVTGQPRDWYAANAGYDTSRRYDSSRTADTFVGGQRSGQVLSGSTSPRDET
jgi:ElaB/YqjD/DUF883 family membrane-anchored ribosome-binding protein